MDDNNCQVFLGSSYVSITETKHFYLPEKIIVFDLDETLGSFGDLYILWSGIKHLFEDFDRFDDLADMYPECIRFGVLTILEYLYKKKQKKQEKNRKKTHKKRKQKKNGKKNSYKHGGL